MDRFITKEKVFVQTNQLAEILINSNGYEDFHNNIVKNNIVCEESKNYEIAGAGFIDFNQHLYEDINHMNSISGGLYLDMTLVMFKIYIWGSKGEGFEIFRHVLRGEEIANLKSIDDIKDYIYKGLSELEDGIVNTYNKETKEAFEGFGKGIETRQLPLPNILKYINLENNINDFR